MTFWAQKREANPRLIDVRVTYGPISITVGEDIGHLRIFHGELGRLLDQAEAPQPAATEGAQL